MTYSVIVRKILRRLDKFLYRPIEVFVFHAVSEEFDENTNKKEDWSSTSDFKDTISVLNNQYTFISLTDAYHRIKYDLFRRKNYAVLTCDDGYRSILDILPFLEEKKIPITLFINPKYLDGVNKREGYANSPSYIVYDQLWSIDSKLITIGMHGYEHIDATKQSIKEFYDSTARCIAVLSNHPRYIPYYAYTWGRYTDSTQNILKKLKIIPVFTDGESNYKFHSGIGRRPIDSYYLRKKGMTQTCNCVSSSRCAKDWVYNSC